MEKILIPTLLQGETIYKEINVTHFEKEQMELLGFRYNGPKLVWDYTYVMTEDPQTFANGEHQRETINLLLKVEI